MSKLSKLAKKIGETTVARIRQTEGGLLRGRDLPKERINDPNWTDLLKLDVPPDEGLYIPRSLVNYTEKLTKEKGKQGKSLSVRSLYSIARVLAEYDAKNNRKSSKSSDIKGQPGQTKSVKTASANDIDPAQTKVYIPSDWNTLTPDNEANFLGLEQLQRGESLSIIGAGISGLTLAWLLTRSRPDLRINIIESQETVGGWMKSTSKEVTDQDGSPAKVIFESGPRTLLPSHPGTQVAMNILAELQKLQDLVGGVPRQSPTNRKGLYYDGEIVQLPRSLGESVRFLLFGKLLKGAKLRALKDLIIPARSRTIDDESVHSFFSRRIGPKITDRMLSALMRGIYAADARDLSARSIARLGKFFYLERSEQMSVLGAAFSGSLKFLDAYANRALPMLYKAMVNPKAPAVDLTSTTTSLLGFPRTGIQSLPKSIYEDLKSRRNVKFYLGSKVETVSLVSSNKVEVKIANKDKTVQSSLVVSTTARGDFFAQQHPDVASKIDEIKYSSLAVVNIWTPEPIAKDWFGILVPNTEHENNEGILGIIFDSSVHNAMRPVAGVNPSQPFAREPGSNITVMIGGDMWPTDGISVEDAEKRAISGLKRILGDFETSKVICQATIQANAIPRYQVGHSVRAHQIHQKISNKYMGRVLLSGMALGRGVAISDCIIDSLMIATRFSQQRKLLHPKFFFGHWYMMTRPEYFN